MQQRLIQALQPRQALLVLDNFEHLLAAAPLVSDLLAACPRLAVLATSRAPLRLAGEQQFAVAPLEVPADWPAAPLDQLAELPPSPCFSSAPRPFYRNFALHRQMAKHSGDLSAAGRLAVGDRAGGGMDQAAAASAVAATPGPSAAAAGGRAARSAGAPAHDARHNRLELRLLSAAEQALLRRLGGLRRRLYPGGGRGGRRQRTISTTAASSPDWRRW